MTDTTNTPPAEDDTDDEPFDASSVKPRPNAPLLRDDPQYSHEAILERQRIGADINARRPKS